MKSTRAIAILLFFTLIAAMMCAERSYLSKSRKNLLHSKARHHMSQEPPAPIPIELPDVAHSGHHELKEFYEIYRGHHMSSGEIRIIFRNADRNKDNKVSFAEWADFHNLFVAPFEMVDQRDEYWLDQADLEMAVSPETGEGWLDGFHLDEEAEDMEFLITQFDRFNQENNLNFADYMFLRKGNLAFKHCASETGIGSRNMPCGLAITSPGRLMSQQDCQEVYNLAFVIQGGNILGNKSRLDFVEFIGVAHLFYYFTEFSLPFDDGIIGKLDVLRGIDEGVLPSTLTPKQIADMYEGFDELPYRGFAGLLWAQRQFNRQDADGDQRLSLDEFLAVLDTPRFNPPLLELIDNLPMPTQEQIEEVALHRLGRPANEKDYLIGFLQKSSKFNKKMQKKSRKSRFSKKFHHRARLHSRHRQVQEDPSFDDPPRNIVYRIFDVSLQDQQKYGDFANFVKYSWLFQSYDMKRLGIINDQNIWQGTKDDISPIPLNKDEKTIVAEMGDWIGGQTGMLCNLKELYIWFRYKKVFKFLRTQGMQVHAIQQRVHTGFAQLGLRLAHATENLMHDGYDQLIQEKHFHFKQMIIYALEDEVLANKINSSMPEE